MHLRFPCVFCQWPVPSRSQFLLVSMSTSLERAEGAVEFHGRAVCQADLNREQGSTAPRAGRIGKAGHFRPVSEPVGARLNSSRQEFGRRVPTAFPSESNPFHIRPWKERGSENYFLRLRHGFLDLHLRGNPRERRRNLHLCLGARSLAAKKEKQDIEQNQCQDYQPEVFHFLSSGHFIAQGSFSRALSILLSDSRAWFSTSFSRSSLRSKRSSILVNRLDSHQTKGSTTSNEETTVVIETSCCSMASCVAAPAAAPTRIKAAKKVFGILAEM